MGFSQVDGAVMNALHSMDGLVTARDWGLTVGNGVRSVNELLVLVRYSIKGN